MPTLVAPRRLPNIIPANVVNKICSVNGQFGNGTRINAPAVINVTNNAVIVNSFVLKCCFGMALMVHPSIKYTIETYLNKLHLYLNLKYHSH